MTYVRVVSRGGVFPTRARRDGPNLRRGQLDGGWPTIIPQHQRGMLRGLTLRRYGFWILVNFVVLTTHLKRTSKTEPQGSPLASPVVKSSSQDGKNSSKIASTLNHESGTHFAF